MPTRFAVAGLDTLAELESRALTLPDGSSCFVVRHHGALYAYRNRCPHWGVDLDLGFGDFVDRRAGRIFCRNHAAEFECDSGRCVRGPCVGKYLDAIRVAEDGDALLLDDVSEPDA